jgi:hypothetical protein
MKCMARTTLMFGGIKVDLGNDECNVHILNI